MRPQLAHKALALQARALRGRSYAVLGRFQNSADAYGHAVALVGDDAALLAAGPDLLKLMGDVRSELFQYEVRHTYDSPDIAESRRIVREAQGGEASRDYQDEGDLPWRDSSG